MNHHITSQHHPKTPQLSFPSHPHHPPCLPSCLPRPWYPHLILQVVATSQLHLFLLDLPSQRTLQDDHETCSNFDLEGDEHRHGRSKVPFGKESIRNSAQGHFRHFLEKNLEGWKAVLQDLGVDVEKTSQILFVMKYNFYDFQPTRWFPKSSCFCTSIEVLGEQQIPEKGPRLGTFSTQIIPELHGGVWKHREHLQPMWISLYST